MILKKVAKKRNYVSYKIIKNSYDNSKISHNYLVSASQFINVDYFLYFLTQTIVCVNGFACGVCNNCSRVLRNKYSDLYILDGSEKSIKKESILHIKNILYQTALENKGVKILVIKNIENTSVEGKNSLLKLIEDPPKHTYIFISTNKIDNLLPTVKSRSQLIRLMNIPRDILIEELINEKIPEDDAFIISLITSSLPKSMSFFKGEYPKYKSQVVEFFEKWILNHYEAKIFLLNINIIKIDIKIFLRLFLVFLNDIWRVNNNKGVSFKNNIALFNLLNKKKFKVFKCIDLTNNLLVDIRSNVNIKLKIYAWVIDMFGDDNDR